MGKPNVVGDTEKKKVTNFSKIASPEDLIAYLDDDAARLDNRSFLYHYTKLGNVIKIFVSRKWHLANARDMNDRLEFDNGDEKRWNNIFFASFMTETKESIGMWSMYAQPWRDGVLIAIPKDIAQNWIKDTKELEEISIANYEPTGRKVTCSNLNRLLLSSVAYSNCDNKETDEKLTWSTAKNELISNAAHIPQLTGYIKDSAWDYEREIRIKAVLAEGHGFQRVAISVPEDVLGSMTIIAGPLFDGNLEDRLMGEINRRVQIKNSLFHNKLSIINTCDNCELRVGRE